MFEGVNQGGTDYVSSFLSGIVRQNLSFYKYGFCRRTTGAKRTFLSCTTVGFFKPAIKCRPTS